MADSLNNDSAAARDALIGNQFGKYRLVGKLGEGGMGVVYEAEDETLRRRVAIKFMNSLEPSARSRFLAEAQAAARLNHPHVVTVHEVAELNGAHLLVMELVRGMSAAEYVRSRGAMEWRVATRVLIAACRGLSAAHKSGLIHRDLKPGNILLAKTGEIKLADFGLAKVLGNSGRSITAAGTALGTPEYMSPEQCGTDAVTEQSDIYSLGATYFALLTGRPPFVRDLPVQTMYSHCTSPIPDPREFAADVPEGCVEVLRKALAKQPHERFDSAEQMQKALQAVLHSSESANLVQRETPDERDSADRREMTLKPDAVATICELPAMPLPLRKLASEKKSTVHFQRMLLGVVATVGAIALGLFLSGWLGSAATTTSLRLDPPKDRDSAHQASSNSEESEGTPAAVNSEEVASSPNRWHAIVVRAQDNRGLFWNGQTEGQISFVSLAMSPDGNYLAARTVGRGNGRLTVWEASSAEPLLDRSEPIYGLVNRSPQPAEFIGCRMLSFDRASRWLAVGKLSTTDFDVEAWPMPPRLDEPPRKLIMDGTVRSLEFSPAEDQLLLSLEVNSGTFTPSVFLVDDWPATQGRKTWSERTHASTVQALTYTADGKSFLATGGPKMRQFSSRNPASNEFVPTEIRPNSLAVATKPEKKPWLVIGGMQSAEIWNIETNQREHILTTEQDGIPRFVNCAAFSPDGAWLLVAGGASGQGRALVFSTSDWSQKGRSELDWDVICALAVIPSKPLALVGTISGQVHLWDLRSLVGDSWSGAKLDADSRAATIER